MPRPRIIVHPMDITRPVTQNATFVCVGQGYGLVDVRWIRRRGGNDRPLLGRSIVTTIVTPDNITSILTIPDLRDGDRGSYRCRYSNSGGEMDTERAALTIGSK